MTKQCAAGRIVLAVTWDDRLRWTWPCPVEGTVRIDGLLDEPVWFCQDHGSSLVNHADQFQQMREQVRKLDQPPTV